MACTRRQSGPGRRHDQRLRARRERRRHAWRRRQGHDGRPAIDAFGRHRRNGLLQSSGDAARQLRDHRAVDGVCDPADQGRADVGRKPARRFQNESRPARRDRRRGRDRGARRNAQRDDVGAGRRSPGPGAAAERPQRRRVGEHASRHYRRHGVRGDGQHARRADHDCARRVSRPEQLHVERRELHQLLADRRVQSAAAGRGAGDPRADVDVLCRVRQQRRRAGDDGYQGRQQSVARVGVGVRSQRRLQRAELLCAAKVRINRSTSGARLLAAGLSRTGCSFSVRIRT